MKRIKSILTICVFWFFTAGLHAQTVKINFGSNKDVVSEESIYGFKISLDFKSFALERVKTKDRDFYVIKAPGFGKSLEYGAPQLPVYKKLIELPEGANYEIEVVRKQTRTIDLKDYSIKDYLYPSQPSVSKAKNVIMPFQLNKDYYTYDRYYKNKIINIVPLGTMRSMDLARLEISPLSYNAFANKIEIIEEIEIRIHVFGFDPDDIKNIKQQKYSPFFNEINKSVLNNLAYRNLDGDNNFASFPLKYVIVSDTMFKQSLQTFIDWKEKKGFKVIEAYTQDSLVGNTAQSIKAFLKNLYDSATVENPAPTFVLFVGDVEQLPTWKGKVSESHVTDLHYCEFTDDYFPEMMYGRFSATDTSELNAQINKTIEYESYSMPEPDFLKKSVLISGFDLTYGAKYGDGQVNYGVKYYFNKSNDTDCKAFLYIDGSYNRQEEIFQVINSGVSIVNYTAHGNPIGWENPAFENKEVTRMTNKGKYPFMIGNACMTNKFDDDLCFGESLLRAKEKGAVGYIGASHNTNWDEDFYWAVGFGSISANTTYSSSGAGLYDRMFHNHNEEFSDWAMCASQYINAGNMAVTQGGNDYQLYWELYHVMGDPSLMPYLKLPDVITATYVPFVNKGIKEYTVKTHPFSLVALSKDNRLVASAVADTFGFAKLYLGSLNVSGNLDLVISAQNMKPFFAKVTCGRPSEPYIVGSNITINDSLGNSNMQVNQDEKVFFSVVFKNLTQYEVENASAKIVCKDTIINLITDSFNLGNMGSFEEFDAKNVFCFNTMANAADDYIVVFDIVVADSEGNEWISPGSFKIYSPKINVNCAIIDDKTYGNNNGYIDAGEKVVVKIPIKNNGSVTAQNIKTSFVSLTNLVKISNNHNIAELMPDSIYYCDYIVEFDSRLTYGQYLNFTFDFVAGAYEGSRSFPQQIGIIGEDFESGNLSSLPWKSTNNLIWIIDTVHQYEGSYSIRSSHHITNEEESVLELTLRVLSDDSISYYRKVSSEELYDKFHFYIDNIHQETVSGEVDWQRVSFFVTEGEHTFRWIYKKDVIFSEGDDAAWIDNIVLPPTDLLSNTECPTENEMLRNFVLTPNPANDKIYLNFILDKNEIVYTRILNQLGQECGTSINHGQFYAGSNKIEMDISSLNSGIYMVQIFIENKMYHHKLIIP